MSEQEIKKLSDKLAKKLKRIQEKYKLPVFNQEKLLQHIEDCVKKAPNGVIGLVIDLFCGAGGDGEGLEQALAENGEKGFVILAGVNHDHKAIYSHAKNHPLAYYSVEDIRTAKLEIILELINLCRERWPQCPIIIWASLECTNLSNAKGGMSRDADSRTLAWHIFRYLDVLNPDGLWIENVKEFQQWGPMMEKVIMFRGKSAKKNRVTLDLVQDEDSEMEFYRSQIKKGFKFICPLEKKKQKTGHPLQSPKPIWIPIKHLKGTFYGPWKEKVKDFGYNNEDWTLNAADYGVPQNRIRFFPIFMKQGYDITRPIATHSKTPTGNLSPHVPVKVCLDFSQEGESIFTPGKITSTRSHERFYAGLVKFIAGGKKNFMMQRNSGDAVSKVYPVEHVSRTITTTGGNQELVSAYFIAKHNSMPGNGVNAGSSIGEAAPTLTCKTTSRLVEAEFLNQNTGDGRIYLTHSQFLDVIYGNATAYSIDRAAPTIRTKDGLQLVSPKFLVNHQGQSNAMSLDNPSPTLLTKEKLALANIEYFICNQYTSGGQVNSIDQAAPAVTTNPKSRVVEVSPWIMPTNFNNVGTSVNEVSPTILASRKHHMLVTSYHGTNILSSIENPSPTIIARQDKSPLSLLISEEGWVAIPVFKTDPEIVVKIKEFMAMYGIADIKTRMLTVKELLKIQSFPENYYLARGLTDQKKYIGNAVPPLLARKIAEAMHPNLVKYMLKKIAA